MVQNTASLSNEALIERCMKLEEQLRIQTAQLAKFTVSQPRKVSTPVKPPKPAKGYSTRFIALKFAYLGHRYNGLEHANRCYTPLPTIEEVIWKALKKTKLINPPSSEHADESLEVLFSPREREQMYPMFGRSNDAGKTTLEVSWEGCQYSKCGRTDKGVSAFGQVIGIRVRSAKPVMKAVQGPTMQQTDDMNRDENEGVPSEFSFGEPEEIQFDSVRDELPYVHMLNTVLPPDIRVLAWSPTPPENFDARFSCQERRYKYFFTNPAFLPTPGLVGMTQSNAQSSTIREGWLDIEAMRAAAKKLEGLHDFRNFCQIDASKQMPNCQRRILYADIEEIDSSSMLTSKPELSIDGQAAANGHVAKSEGVKGYAIVLHGTAFLWHQVRCTAAILFLVGQGLEEPGVIDKMLDIKSMPGRPHYTMADDAPLVLWDCVFPEEMGWIYAGDEASLPSLTAKGDGKFGVSGIVDEVWKQWHELKLKEIQLSRLIELTMGMGDMSSLQRGGYREPRSVRSQKVFEGDTARFVGKYQPLVNRQSMDTLEVSNKKYMSSNKGMRWTAKKEAEGQDTKRSDGRHGSQQGSQDQTQSS